ncbi:DUF2164 domain-containing protein [Desulfonispora thiosulfatigenes]|nr:DUF2164 domain-containing protein [Desulfonispora thiosulfatigenes]
MFNKIGVSKDIEKEMVFAIQDYFLKEREEDLGNLEASFILDFFMEKLAPQIYNQGVYDSYKYMEERTEDLLGILKG